MKKEIKLMYEGEEVGKIISDTILSVMDCIDLIFSSSSPDKEKEINKFYIVKN